jgi:hypothetical protein
VTAALVAICLALATATVAVVAGTAVGRLGAVVMRDRRLARLGARTRASLLAQLRLAPLGLALPAGLVVQMAFWRFEPPHAVERVGPVLVVLAATGALAVAATIVRVARALQATRTVRRRWRQSAMPVAMPGWSGRAYRVESTYPVVAVLGVSRPELFVAGRVADACSPDEIAVVAAHELAHVVARDNLMRAAFVATPFPGRTAAWLESAWAAASEEAADLAARGGGSGLTLASALLKVAGLAGPGEPRAVLASALIGDSGSLEGRVRRLLAPPPALGRGAWWLGATLAVALVVGSSPALRHVYLAAELLVGLGR